jgi:hypothetical protein
MNKQTQILIGIGAVAVVGYFIWKNNKKAPCPEYVDCMPGPENKGRCYIPPHCEGITKKVH